jgi:hypothetical protein
MLRSLKSERANEYLLSRSPLRQEERDQTERTAAILFSSRHEYPQSVFGVQFGQGVQQGKVWIMEEEE